MNRFLIAVIAAVLFSLAYAPDVPAFGGCEEDCMKCHTIQKSEVEQILTKLQAPHAKVLDLRLSPVKGLWEAAIEDQGNRAVIYIGFSKKHVMAGPIVEVETGENKTGETLSRVDQANPRKVDVAKIPVKHALLMGSADARYKAFVFTDPDCPYCGKLHAELKKVVEADREIAFYLKFLPLPMHPDAPWKSQSIICSRSLKLLEENFEKKPIPKPECTTPEIDDNIKLAQEIGITGTPTMVMPDGTVVMGVKDAAKIAEMVKAPLQKGQNR